MLAQLLQQPVLQTAVGFALLRHRGERLHRQETAQPPKHLSGLCTCLILLQDTPQNHQNPLSEPV